MFINQASISRCSGAQGTSSGALDSSRWHQVDPQGGGTYAETLGSWLEAGDVMGSMETRKVRTEELVDESHISGLE